MDINTGIISCTTRTTGLPEKQVYANENKLQTRTNPAKKTAKNRKSKMERRKEM
jgi:hypothetical protein